MPGVISPLTDLTEEENLFRESVAEFATERIGPHAPEMDQRGEFRRELIDEFFDLGLMGIEIPEEYGNLLIAHKIFEVLANHGSGLSVAARERDRQTAWTETARRMREEERAVEPREPK